MRPSRSEVEPHSALGFELEKEREVDGSLLPTVTVFLAGAECPYTCVFCDLWRYTLDGATPHGALPRQLEAVLENLDPEFLGGRIKLYNASNFFDPRAVPPEDLEAIAELLEAFSRVVVECHARFVGETCFELARRLEGRLELALGLEVAETEVLDRLGKSMTLEDFDQAAAGLGEAGIPWRAFVLVRAPYLPPAERGSEGETWEKRSVRYAFDRGAERVTLIPTRAGNGAMDELANRGVWRPPTLGEMERALDESLDLGLVSLDLWDLERFASCEVCFPARRSRLQRIHDSGRRELQVVCHACRT